jgi:hypothetical protein
MSNSCANCIYSELVYQEGDSYSFVNPNGDEVTRQYPQTVLICRAMPPIAGSWPQVVPEDWCGQGKFS